MFEFLRKLFGGQPESPRSPAVPRPDPEDSGGLKPLTPLDAPMILARIRALGILERLDEHDKEVMERTIKTRCREGRLEPWWGPLRAHARRMGRRDANRFLVVFSKRLRDLAALEAALLSLGDFDTGKSFIIEKVLDRSGEPIDPDAPVTDGEVQVLYKANGQEGRFSVRYDDGLVDPRSAVAVINTIFRGQGWPERLLLLPEYDDVVGVALCNEHEAGKARDIGWGTLVFDEPGA